MNSVYIEISNACNLKCTFCPSPNLKTQRQFMSTEQFKATLQNIKGVTQEIQFHVLGEPLLHPLLNDFFNIAHLNQFKVNLTTNGVFIARQTQTLLSSQSLRQINFSIHALQELKNPDLAYQTFLEVLTFIEKSFEQRPDLYINLRLWNAGVKDDIQLIQWNQKVTTALQSRFGVSIINTPFNPRTKSKNLLNRLYLHSDSRFEWPADSIGKASTLSRTKGTCKALDTHCAILVDGSVVPCCLDYRGDIKLGNLKVDSLSTILTNTRATEMREGFKKGFLVEELCQSCQFCKRFSK